MLMAWWYCLSRFLGMFMPLMRCICILVMMIWAYRIAESMVSPGSVWGVNVGSLSSSRSSLISFSGSLMMGAISAAPFSWSTCAASSNQWVISSLSFAKGVTMRAMRSIKPWRKWLAPSWRSFSAIFNSCRLGMLSRFSHSSAFSLVKFVSSRGVSPVCSSIQLAISHNASPIFLGERMMLPVRIAFAVCRMSSSLLWWWRKISTIRSAWLSCLYVYPLHAPWCI